MVHGEYSEYEVVLRGYITLYMETAEQYTWEPHDLDRDE